MRRPLVLVLMLVLAACSSGGGDGDSPPARGDVEAFAGSQWDALVARYQALTQATPAFAQVRFGLHERASFVARQWQLASSGHLRLDGAAASECLVAIAAATDLWALQEARSDPAGPCRRALHGTISAGGACGRAADCAANLYCDHAAYACPGTCTPRGAAGTVCSAAESFSECLYGYSCFFTPGAMTGTCRAVSIGEGAECGETRYCRAGLYCSAAATPSRCMRYAGPGESCATVPCDPALRCVSGTCQLRFARGEPCLPGECQLGTRCGPAGLCLDVPVDGGACGTVDAGEPAWCLLGVCSGDPGTCSSLVPVGEPCAAGDLCKFSGFCDTGRLSCADVCG